MAWMAAPTRMISANSTIRTIPATTMGEKAGGVYWLASASAACDSEAVLLSTRVIERALARAEAAEAPILGRGSVSLMTDAVREVSFRIRRAASPLLVGEFLVEKLSKNAYADCRKSAVSA